MTRGENIQELIDKCETNYSKFDSDKFYNNQSDWYMRRFYENAHTELTNELHNMTIAEAEERTV